MSMKKVELYDIFKLDINDIPTKQQVNYCCTFEIDGSKWVLPVFRISENKFRVHFMPNKIGIWQYKIVYKNILISGTFECVKTDEKIHGLVVANQNGFSYSDNSKYIPFGTTCYSWINQDTSLQKTTLSTLAKSPFNKVRMCIFPKSMPYNQNDPEYFPFKKDECNNWLVDELDYRFWDNLENRISSLNKLGIEADLILFHPYDRWGFASLNQTDSMKYLDYVVARFAAYRNVWWSLANEYEMLYNKTLRDWDEYGERLMEIDPYHHMTSIHNIIKIYPKRQWMTHCSIQSTNINNILNWRNEYQLPIIIDECGYEGNIDYAWGNLSAMEMVHRFWVVTCRGGYCSHGETFHRDDEILWWAKGGKLYGKSSERIEFLKSIIYELPSDGKPKYREYFIDPNTKKLDKEEKYGFKDIVASLPVYQQKELVFTEPMILQGENFILRYMGKTAQAFVDMTTPNKDSYKIEIIDSWEMTREIVKTGVKGKIRLPLPEKEGIAVLFTNETNAIMET